MNGGDRPHCTCLCAILANSGFMTIICVERKCQLAGAMTRMLQINTLVEMKIQLEWCNMSIVAKYDKGIIKTQRKGRVK